MSLIGLRWAVDNERYWLPWASFLLFIAVWQSVAAADVVSPFFGSPVGVIKAGAESIPDPSFWNDVRLSGTEFLIGYVAGMLVGAPLGLIAGWFRRAGYAAEPWLNGLNATPRIALLPLVALWVGIGPPATTSIVFLGVFFLVALNTFYGVRTVSPAFLRVAGSFGASEVRVFATIVLPSTLPFILAGAKLGIGRGVVGMMVGEFYGSQDGLGNFIFVAGGTGQVDKVLFGALFITALALGAFAILQRLEARFQAWRPEVRAG